MKESNQASEPRFFQLDNVHNLRDYGGYATSNGGRLVMKKLFRSGDFSNASANDLEVLAEFNFQSFIDLRGQSERSEDTVKITDTFSKPIFFSDGETAINAPLVAPHLEGLDSKQSAGDIRKEMIRRYADMPFRLYLNETYQKYLKVLSSSNEASVVFCSAGKDRTGLLVAIVQSLLGVHRDDIFEEFLLTNVAPGQDARVEALKRHLHSRFGAGLTKEAIAVITSVEPAFLESAIAAITSSHGSIEAYAKDALKLDEEMYSSLVANFTVIG